MSGLIDRWDDYLIARGPPTTTARAWRTPRARSGALIPHGGRV
jgi:hypothetical protein